MGKPGYLYENFVRLKYEPPKKPKETTFRNKQEETIAMIKQAHAISIRNHYSKHALAQPFKSEEKISDKNNTATKCERHQRPPKRKNDSPIQQHHPKRRK